MAKYVIKRVAYGVVTLFVLVSLTFFMQQLLPGDPFVGEKNLPEATMEALYAKYGLDKPVWMQYFIYLGNVLHGDLGISLQNDRPVTTVIGESFVVSFDVGIRAILFAFILGVVLGTLAAIKRGTAWTPSACWWLWWAFPCPASSSPRCCSTIWACASPWPWERLFSPPRAGTA